MRRGAAAPGLAALLLAVSCMAAAAPRVPASGAEVLEVLPWRNDPQQRELRALRTELAWAPRDPGRATSVARRYIEAGRREADPRYFGYAQAALVPWWSQAAPPPEVRLLRATLLQSVHRFPEALADLEAVTAQDGTNVQAWLTRATIETVRADYPAATRSCARLSTLAGELVTAVCIANVGAVSGRLRASADLLERTFARAGGADPGVDAWALGSLAELRARDGATTRADALFRQALQLAPRDTYLLGAYADFLLDTHRPAEVLTLLDAYRRVDGLLLRHALAAQQTARRGLLSRELTELDARFAAAERRGDSVHLREQARYELALRGHAARALVLARRNWEAQKETADARILLEAAVAARDPAAAQPVVDWMRAAHVEDGLLARLAKALQTAGGPR